MYGAFLVTFAKFSLPNIISQAISEMCLVSCESVFVKTSSELKRN